MEKFQEKDKKLQTESVMTKDDFIDIILPTRTELTVEKLKLKAVEASRNIQLVLISVLIWLFKCFLNNTYSSVISMFVFGLYLVSLGLWSFTSYFFFMLPVACFGIVLKRLGKVNLFALQCISTLEKFSNVYSRQLSTSLERARKPLYLAIKLAAAATIGTAVGLAGREIYDRVKKVIYTDPTHKVNSENYEMIRAEENLVGATHPDKSIPVKGSKIWTTIWSNPELGSHFGDPADLYNALSKNIKTIRVTTDVGQVTTHGLGISGNFMMLNLHSIPNSDTVELLISSNNDFTNPSTIRRYVLPQSEFHKVSTDLVLFRCSGMNFRNILHHFINTVDGKKFKAHFDGVDTYAVSKAEYSEFETPARPYRLYGVDRTWQYHCPVSRYGSCGKPLIAQINSSSVILGIHAGGLGEMGCAIDVTGKDIKLAIDSYNDNLVPIKPLVVKSESLEAPLPKSVFRYENTGPLDYYGRLPGNVMANSRSCLKKTKLKEVAHELTGVEYEPFGKPLMKAQGKGDSYRSPYNNAIRKFNKAPKTLKRDVMHKVVDYYSKYLITELSNRNVRLAPLPMIDVVNGVEENPYYRRVNMSTAGGHGFPGKKNKYFSEVDADTHQVAFTPDEELMTRLKELVESYMSDEPEMAIFNGSLKDEPRPLDKVASGSTRIFYASPLDHLLVSKMAMKPFYSTMVNHGDLFGSAIGVDMHSGAERIVKALRFKKIIEGDYSGFDQNIPYDIKWVCASILYNVCAALGYNPPALELLRGSLSVMLHPAIKLLNDLFVAHGLQPSGKDGTAEDNTFIGRVLLMYFWFDHPILSTMDFMEHIGDIIYGDDVLISVSDDVSSFFNTQTYTQYCRDIYGIGFTSACKSNDERNDFMSIDEVSFLKRTLVFRDDLDRWVAPIDKKSLYKMLVWTIPSQIVAERDQVIASVHSYLWELALHVQSDEHARQFFILRNALHEHYGFTEDEDLPTYDYIIEAIFS
jgi:hypothetical protein